ncbi:protein SCO1/2 [Oceanobacillus limi]|uniref:Protein SCO1/2 n=1 Tax=Oceanobacillus limi TaxID=930131 RepID=A0A1I0AIA1_9BACI|nr:SCO family protein [Oceanobacillus limi]SES93924.1 protein SCO1/2 [Oceanobacillus limi]
MKYLKFILPVALALLVACGGIETNMSKDVQPFEFTTQDNETLSNEDLQGKWWIADLIFTNCTTVCIPMTANMAQLQEKMKEEGLENVELVSFSVDPEYDTPEVLKQYAEDYNVDLDNWTFLTGYDFQTIKELSIKTFMQPLEAPPEDSDQVMHGTRFFLVNPEGEVIKHYKGTSSEELDTILDDLNKVVE